MCGWDIPEKGKILKTVAIYGFAPQTRHLISQSKAEEVWSLNNFYNYGLKESQVTRTFEMHELWIQYVSATRSEGGVEYWNWILEPHDFPIYMHKIAADFAADLDRIRAIDISKYTDEEYEHYDEAIKEARFGVDFFKRTKANIIKYPLDAVIDDILPPLDNINLEVFPPRGIKPYFSSSMDYMAALAIHEKFGRIEFYGIELKEQTEWAIQKAGMEFWVGMAKGRGIQFCIPYTSVLVSAPLYGLGDAQMIPVQVPEALRRKYIDKMDYWRTIYNKESGRFDALMRAGDKEAAQLVYVDLDKAKCKIYMYEGAANAMTHQIDHENLNIDDLSIETVTKFEQTGKG